MTLQTNAPDQQILADLGMRLARHRLNRNLTQDQLAREAGVSKRTLVRLERGQSGQLISLIRVLRALGLPRNLNALAPTPLASPVEALKTKSRERRRASPPHKIPGAKWTWNNHPPSPGGEP